MFILYFEKNIFHQITSIDQLGSSEIWNMKYTEGLLYISSLTLPKIIEVSFPKLSVGKQKPSMPSQGDRLVIEKLKDNTIIQNTLKSRLC